MRINNVSVSLDRLLSHIRISNDLYSCWEWVGPKHKHGYGQFKIQGKMMLAHRIIWEIENGDPGEFYVLHRCDNRHCVRPSHLFLGTHQDNMADMRSKNRQQGHRFTEREIAQIRQEIAAGGERLKDIGRRWGCSHTTISRIKCRKGRYK